jgi:hypothetical protein
VQSGTLQVSETTTSTLTGVTAGSTLVVVLTQVSTSGRTYTVSDDVNGTWTNSCIGLVANRHADIYWETAAGAGDTVITVDSGTADAAPNWRALEVSNAENVGVACVEQEPVTEGTSIDFFPATADIPAESIIFGVFQSDANTATFTITGYTKFIDDDTNNNALAAYKITVGSITDETGTFTQGTARDGPAVALAFTDDGGGGGSAVPPASQNYRRRRN